MTKSLEALDELSLMINREKHINSEWNKKINDLKQTIKQDLEKLELIEALYNKSLKELENIKDVDRELYLKYKALENENKELLVNKNLAQGIALKYKKVIEIIKNKCISNSNLWLVYNSKNYIDYECFVKNKDHELVRIEHNILTEKEFDLLKEVLE